MCKPEYRIFAIEREAVKDVAENANRDARFKEDVGRLLGQKDFDNR